MICIMRLTYKDRYTVTSIINVTLHSDRWPVPLAKISEHQGIFFPNLEQLSFEQTCIGGKHTGLIGGGFLLG
ncbi:MAG: DNA-binding transcriptional dual regulator IscR [Sodalis sp. Psp]|nr:DNA-binding transcriptional dual regulator IscR [Sodalis sp. Psp]MCR3757299.1 DNA-binding transcriptional dual regulator IscR [Sodalis sp. Ppy]